MKKILLILSIFFIPLQTLAFEDCIITTKGKLTDISIEDNKMVDVYPLITVGNDKNTLMVSPMKEGKTRFCVLKNNKDIVMFNIEITKNKTKIDDVKGFEIFTLDSPFEELALDAPPKIEEEQ